MTSIVLPIKPIFVGEILKGRKRYEYRKSICKKAIDKIYIYATSPIKKVVAEVKVSGTISDDKEEVWKVTGRYSGISKEFYDKYFKENKIACAYSLGEVTVYPEPKELKEFGINFYPQSYVYVYVV